MRDLYREVTDSIIADLERGVIPWLKPWKNGIGPAVDVQMPRNAVTNRAYSGINVFLLWARASARGYGIGRWLTYRQAQAAGGYVRKGETGTMVIYVNRVQKRTKGDNGQTEEKTIPLMRAYTVFNVAQCDGLPDKLINGKPLPPEPVLDELFAQFVAATNAKISHGGDRAFYSPAFDSVQMPHKAAFADMSNYKATLLHELAHWTGHDSRLKRDFSGRFGNEAYAFEELVAEISAAFLCAHLGVKGDLRHAAYVDNWLTVLKKDRKAIFTAASQASKAADLLRSFSETAEESDADEMPIAA